MSVIKLRRSAVKGKAPSTGDFAVGELALNTVDGIIYVRTEDSSNTAGVSAIKEITEGTLTIDPSGLSNATGTTLSAVLDDLDSAIAAVSTGATQTDASITGDGTSGSPLSINLSSVRNAIGLSDLGGDGSLSYDSSTGRFTFTGPSASEVRAHFTGGTGITITNGTITTTDGDIVHDNLSGFVGNEHIDHSSVSITAGNGLTGGGDITTSRTINVVGGNGINVNANNVEIDSADIKNIFSAGGDLSYDSSTGQFSYTDSAQHTSAQIRAMFSASGDLSYNSTTGAFSYTDSAQHTSAQIRAMFSGGTGVTYNSTTGAISIGQAVATSSNVEFADVTASGDVVITGDLTVNGSTVTNSATNTTIEDALIELGSGNSGANTNDLGLILERGSTGDNVFMGWDESIDRVRFATTTATGASTGDLTLSNANVEAGRFYGDLTGDVTGTVSDISNFSTSDLSEGTNKYFTNERVDDRVNSLLSAGVNVALSYDDANNDLEIRVPYENIQDIVGAQLVTNGSHTGITASYDDANDAAIDLAVSSSHVRGLFSASGDLSYNSGTGAFSFSETYSSASELLTAIKTVDGATSGLDADLLDGQHGSYYRINIYNSSGVLQN